MRRSVARFCRDFEIESLSLISFTDSLDNKFERFKLFAQPKMDPLLFGDWEWLIELILNHTKTRRSVYEGCIVCQLWKMVNVGEMWALLYEMCDKDQ